ncbi:two-component system sensor histidine kinase CpxA [Vibrio sp. 10N.286.49.C2]|uniref:envelope stress sensor histidine kinase CpxA n=1 Tax=unclassified Vibrio TaxID=2614977 RepID=UPI000C863E55|nr:MULTISPECIES: envelope stress sensor histidine kinase CpxA [unclassified Vibrio]PMH36852.1 two-component system sensor histidine kinase CpxA [Vibrio sp. 10N.286.49.C2]PMH47915.1 two-component system sensor histidine kinase CpxA [Vibrio sp. 10N.286.49.B1]PMH83305.1 two-component system sensor histidine kinase CpxA [Vibrio sp. 10N.286.48.B7]
MKLPNVTSLYGRIFAIFWFTMLLVLIAVLSLPHLDPRVAREVQGDYLQQLYKLRDNTEQRFEKQKNLGNIIYRLEQAAVRSNNHRKSDAPQLFLADLDGNLLSTQRLENFKIKALKNFITSVESPQTPLQKLYGRHMVAGPVPITLANQDLQLFIALKWNQPPPFLLRMFDKPFQLLLAVMAVSTPLLLWLAWALSQPARRLERAAKRVAKGEFKVDPSLEKGTSEFKQAGTSFNQMVVAINQIISGQQRLLSDISHELRSPLTRLRMATALANRKQGESSELSRIDTEAQRLEQMIGELLELSRISTDSHTLREIQPASSLWEAILDDAQFEAEQMDKTLTFSTIPEASLCGNPKLLMSAIENIIRNAIRYGHDKIEVNIQQQVDTLIITVEDNGPGVPDDELNDIFRPFYRVSTARDRDSGGTGLGLAITQSAILQHSGQIEASRSDLGGLKMRVELPLA